MENPKIRFKGFTKDWEQRKVSELSEKTFGGGTPKTSNYSFWKGNIPWIQSSDLIEDSLFDVEPRKYISQEAVDKSATKLVPENSVAIVTRVGVGKLAFMPFSYATSQDFLSLCELQTEPQFIVYALYKKLKLEFNAVQGTSIKGITKDELLAQKIMIPCYEEQGKIGNYLHSLDHLITLHQRKCEQTKKLKKYMLQKMFPQNGEKVPEIRFDGFTYDWEQRKFCDVAVRASSVSTSSSDIPSVEYEDVVAEEGRLNKDIRLKEAVKSGIIFDGSQVLYGKLRPYLHNWLNPDFNGIAVGDWWVLKPINMDKNFLYRLIQTQQFDNIANQSSGSKMPRADWNLISNSDFMVPFSKEEQCKIGGYFDSLDNLITLHQRKCDELKKMKKYMLQNMFI